MRIGQLDEAVQILKGMWTVEAYQFEGRHYRVGVGEVKNYRGQKVSLSGAHNHPKPVQKPHPPLWIAGGGEQLTLRTVARYGDYANFMGSLEQIQHKNRVLDLHCDRQGRDPSDIKRSVNANVFLGNDAELEKLLQDCGRSPSDIEGLKSMLYPREPQALVDHLGKLRDQARVDTVILYFPDAARGDSLEKFAAEIAPALAR